MIKWKSSTSPGVRYREHPTRKNGSVKKDRYFSIRFQMNGKRTEEALGWASEGWTAEKAAEELANLKRAARAGSGPRTLGEARKIKNRELREQESREISLHDYYYQHYLPFAQQSKPGSWDKEESHMRLHIDPVLGNVPHCDIQIPQWDDLVLALSKKKLSQRSIEYITGFLRRVLKHALRRKIVTIPPPSGKDIGATAPKNNRRQRIITPAERRKIMSTLEEQDHSSWMISQFAFLTGCRAGEAFKLEWRNVSSTHVIFEKTKNSESRRIPISGPLAELISELQRTSPIEKVFLNSRGLPYNEAPTAFAHVSNSIGFNEGRDRLDRISFHTIRHTVATELAKALDLRSLMDVMGWKVPAMALRYMHGDEEAARCALDMLGESGDGGKVIPFRKRG